MDKTIKTRKRTGTDWLHIPVLHSVLAPSILDAAEMESLMGGRKETRIKLL